MSNYKVINSHAIWKCLIFSHCVENTTQTWWLFTHHRKTHTHTCTYYADRKRLYARKIPHNPINALRPGCLCRVVTFISNVIVLYCLSVTDQPCHRHRRPRVLIGRWIDHGVFSHPIYCTGLNKIRRYGRTQMYLIVEYRSSNNLSFFCFKVKSASLGSSLSALHLQRRLHVSRLTVQWMKAVYLKAGVFKEGSQTCVNPHIWKQHLQLFW